MTAEPEWIAALRRSLGNAPDTATMDEGALRAEVERLRRCSGWLLNEYQAVKALSDAHVLLSRNAARATEKGSGE